MNIYTRFNNRKIIRGLHLQGPNLMNLSYVATGSTMYNNVQQCTTMYNSVQQCTTMYNNVQQCATMYNNVQQGTTMYNYVQLREFT